MQKPAADPQMRSIRNRLIAKVVLALVVKFALIAALLLYFFPPSKWPRF
ncbi:MAG: hypothetical protein KGL46_05625 [Hyphomicrobiales bacterium]|nr:hypothetical protein [Hyphomicrobiales bacterium]